MGTGKFIAGKKVIIGRGIRRPKPVPIRRPKPNMANPAAVFAQQQGLKSDIVTAPDGSQSGWITLPSGQRVNQWVYFRENYVPPIKKSVSQIKKPILRLRRKSIKQINDLKNPKLRIAKGIFSQIGKDLKRTVNTGVKAGKLINQDLSRRKRERELSEIKIRKTQARIRKRRRVKSQSRGKR